ncbi:hypothetical protein NDU88_003325 [Pleurodeles waltl]|uniref:Uncharacterized protein n=1 Tax=Pleurodeles waltl TaxID=8319 RepID=A0AAV7VF29_PLEWA|nr:hypothetical protein NDU88_003325 [Pleurodeles waltl]
MQRRVRVGYALALLLHRQQQPSCGRGSPLPRRTWVPQRPPGRPDLSSFTWIYWFVDGRGASRSQCAAPGAPLPTQSPPQGPVPRRGHSTAARVRSKAARRPVPATGGRRRSLGPGATGPGGVATGSARSLSRDGGSSPPNGASGPHGPFVSPRMGLEREEGGREGGGRHSPSPLTASASFSSGVHAASCQLVSGRCGGCARLSQLLEAVAATPVVLSFAWAPPRGPVPARRPLRRGIG